MAILGPFSNWGKKKKKTPRKCIYNFQTELILSSLHALSNLRTDEKYP